LLELAQILRFNIATETRFHRLKFGRNHSAARLGTAGGLMKRKGRREEGEAEG
jgi:hypothetical protein